MTSFAQKSHTEVNRAASSQQAYVTSRILESILGYIVKFQLSCALKKVFSEPFHIC